MQPTEHSPYCIALQPICDRALHHVADKLLYRSHCGLVGWGAAPIVCSTPLIEGESCRRHSSISR